jgi:amino acid transporter
MVLGLLAFVGFETGAVYGEEAREPHRIIPLATFSLIIGLCVLYTWTAYAATIGVGWSHAVTLLGNVNIAPTQFISLANRYVGIWLGVGLTIFVLTSNAASAFAMHQVMVRYLYAMGREGLVFPILGKTHPRWKSPHWAILLQSSFTGLVILLLGLVIQRTDAQGNTFYALGWANTIWQQTNGITSFGWLASVVTMLILMVYILANLALPRYARSRGVVLWKGKFLIPAILFPSISSLLLLLPLGSYILPAVPGPVGDFFTHLGFAPTPFPANILPLFALAWMVSGMLSFEWTRRRAPELLEKLGRIIRTEG